MTAPTVPEMKALGSSPDGDTHRAAAHPVLDPDAPVIVQTAQALAMNIRDVPGWEDDARLITAHCHAVTLIEDLSAPTEKGDGVVVVPGSWSGTVTDYILHYGSGCRECADNNGYVCPATGLACDPEMAKRGANHALAAIRYGTKHGYLRAMIAATQQATGGEGE